MVAKDPCLKGADIIPILEAELKRGRPVSKVGQCKNPEDCEETKDFQTFIETGSLENSV